MARCLFTRAACYPTTSPVFSCVDVRRAAAGEAAPIIDSLTTTSNHRHLSVKSDPIRVSLPRLRLWTAVFSTRVQSRGGAWVLTGVLSNSRNQKKKDLRVGNWFLEALRRHHRGLLQ
jgi:hypothetical protein